EGLNSATVTSSTVQLLNPSNVAVAATISYNAATKVVTITPTAALAGGAIYTVSVKGGAGGVTDAAGNPLAATTTWQFTTIGKWTQTTVADFSGGSNSGTTV